MRYFDHYYLIWCLCTASLAFSTNFLHFDAFDRYKDIIHDYRNQNTSKLANLNLPRVITERGSVGHKVESNNVIHLDDFIVLNLKPFKNVIKISNSTILVDGGCTMSTLIEHSLKYNLRPNVLPELKSMTIGGAIVGCGLESTSFKYGQFNDIVKRIWVLTNGEIVECAKNSELWCSIAGSYGSLGIILAAEIELIKTESFVEIEIQYYPNNVTNKNNIINKLTGDKNLEFLESIRYPDGITAIIKGKSVNSSNATFYDPDQYNELWFYEKIKSIQSLKSTQKICIPIKSYLFRYDRCAFWMGRPLQFSWNIIFRSPMLLPLFIITHNNIICRNLFRWLFTTTKLYRLLKLADTEIVKQRMIITDVSHFSHSYFI